MPASSDRPFLGIFLKSAAVLLFVVMTMCIKSAGDLHAGQLLFFRSLFGMIPLFLILSFRGKILEGIKTDNPLGHAGRGLVGVLSMGLTFYAISVLPLANAILLGYAMPLFVVLFGALAFHERVGRMQWVSVVLGFAGVVVISWPDLSLASAGDGDSLRTFGVIAALVGAVLAAWAMLLVKQLVRTEASTTVVVWFSIFSTLFSGLTFLGWRPMSATGVGLLLLAGIIGGLAQILMTESYRHADASIIAPFEYTSIIYSIILGFIVFGDVPTIYVLIGGGIVLSAGVIMGLSELAGRRGAGPAPVAVAPTDSAVVGAIAVAPQAGTHDTVTGEAATEEAAAGAVTAGAAR